MSHFIGDEVFKTKKAIKQRCREIISNGVQPDDIAFLNGLICRHPDAPQKIGSGIKSFFVGQAPIKNTWQNTKASRCLNIERVDGTTTDFSFYACITEPSKQTQLNLALRRCVDDQILKFKHDSFLKGYNHCAITGDALDYQSAHVDHAEPRFIDIVKSWMIDRELKPDDIKLGHADNTTAWIEDDELSKDFSEFHRLHANLRMTTASANLTRKRGTSK